MSVPGRLPVVAARLEKDPTAIYDKFFEPFVDYLGVSASDKEILHDLINEMCDKFRTIGYDDAYNEGFEDGRADAHDEYYDEGFQEGYDSAREEYSDEDDPEEDEDDKEV